MSSARRCTAVLRSLRHAFGLMKPAALVGLAGLACAAEPMRVPDTMAQRMLACTGCHGPQGRASNEGFVPRIAGKPAAYLQRQLQSFRDGGRRHDGMARLLEGLPDAYLLEIATYFALLDLPPEVTPGPSMSAAAVTRAVQLVREGDRRLNVPPCAACHGERLGGTLPGVPGLAGLPRAYTMAQLGAWRVGMRSASAPDCMSAIAKALQPWDLTALADWLAVQPAALVAPTAAAAAPVACGGMAPP